MLDHDRIPVSVGRLWVMRAMYLFMAGGIAMMVWPFILSHDPGTPRMTGVALALLGAIGLLAALGLRYPLQMIPLLLFEFAWKMIWLCFFALPLWLGGRLDEAHAMSVYETSFGFLLLLVIPWGYVNDNYVRRPADPWRQSASASAGSSDRESAGAGPAS